MKRSLIVATLMALVASTATAEVQFYTDEVAFQNAISASGMASVGTVDFSNVLVPAGSFAEIDDPLDIDHLQGVFDPSDFTIDDLTFQSTTDPSIPAPVGTDGLWIVTPGFAGVSEYFIVANILASPGDVEGLDILARHTALSMTMGTVTATNPQTEIDIFVYVYDNGGALIGTQLNLLQPEPNGGFFGIINTSGSMGRVFLTESSGGAQVGVTRITAYVPEPSSLVLVALGVLALARCRRRR
ncbi:MAG: PEP-CTERM sorting domain-containing protein [Pirellulales bacterium]